jgi:hypothetical protein
MITAVCGIFVLGLTIGAHGESRHRRPLSVVRDVFYDCEAWPAVGAVGERIAISPGGWVKSLRQTIWADAYVGGNWLERPGDRLRCDDLERRKAIGQANLMLQLINIRQGGGFKAQLLNKFLQRSRGSIDLNIDSGGGVAHPPFQIMAKSKRVDKGAKTYALDDTGNMNSSALQWLHSIHYN